MPVELLRSIGRSLDRQIGVARRSGRALHAYHLVPPDHNASDPPYRREAE